MLHAGKTKDTLHLYDLNPQVYIYIYLGLKSRSYGSSRLVTCFSCGLNPPVYGLNLQFSPSYRGACPCSDLPSNTGPGASRCPWLLCGRSGENISNPIPTICIP